MKILILLFVLSIISTKVVLRSKQDLMHHKTDRKLLESSDEEMA